MITKENREQSRLKIISKMQEKFDNMPQFHWDTLREKVKNENILFEKQINSQTPSIDEMKKPFTI